MGNTLADIERDMNQWDSATDIRRWFQNYALEKKQEAPSPYMFPIIIVEREHHMEHKLKGYWRVDGYKYNLNGHETLVYQEYACRGAPNPPFFELRKPWKPPEDQSLTLDKLMCLQKYIYI